MVIKRTVSFVLLLQDDFSGAVQSDPGQRFCVNGRTVCPMKKPEGYLVFFGLSGTEYEVSISSAKYLDTLLHIDSGKLDPKYPVVTVRLFRKPGVWFPDSEWLDGCKGKPGQMAVLPSPETLSLSLRTMEDAGDGSVKVGLMGYSTRDLVGLRFSVGQKADCETFIITRKLDEGQYLIDRPLLKKHKSGDQVVRTFAAMCGENGGFSIPVEPGYNSKDPAFQFLKAEAM